MAQALESAGFIFDAGLRVWRRPSHTSIAYSDGDDTERRIAEIVNQAQDLSVFSAELNERCTDWPSTYHLSRKRANLLRPFQAQFRNAQVLELGAGCGALTRFMGECGADVLAVEGALPRAAIAASRCRDLPNVQVVAENIDRFPQAPSFDFVMLIGVLEYARKFFSSDTDDPVDAMLAYAKGFLKPSGRLIVGIENQLGLKYFAGYPEDHIGRPMFGIEDRYPSDGIVTFGKRELYTRLNAAGFSTQEWWYPLPDYKLPSALISERGAAGQFDLSAMIGPVLSEDLQRPRDPTLSIEQAFRPILRNGLAGELANSFLVIAGNGQKAKSSLLAYYFTVSRRPEFAKQVTFDVRGQSKILVRRERIFPGADTTPDCPLTMHLVDEPFTVGTNWAQHIKDIVTWPGWSFSDLCGWASVWLYTVLREGKLGGKRSELTTHTLVSGNLIDAIPRNLIIGAGEDRSATFIDQEWKLPESVELGFVLFRGLAHTLSTVGPVAKPATEIDLRIAALCAEISNHLGLPFDEDDLARYIELENKLQFWVTGRPGLDFGAVFYSTLPVRRTLSDLDQLASEIQEARLLQARAERRLTVAIDTREKTQRELTLALAKHHTNITEAERHRAVAEQRAAHAAEHGLEVERRLNDVIRLLAEAERRTSEDGQARIAAERRTADAFEERNAAASRIVEAMEARASAERHLAEAVQARHAAETRAAEAEEQRIATEQRLAATIQEREAVGRHAAETNELRIVAEQRMAAAVQAHEAAELRASETRERDVAAERRMKEAVRAREAAERRATEAEEQRLVAERRQADAAESREIAESLRAQAEAGRRAAEGVLSELGEFVSASGAGNGPEAPDHAPQRVRDEILAASVDLMAARTRRIPRQRPRTWRPGRAARIMVGSRLPWRSFFSAMRDQRTLEELCDSPLFDPAWYLSQRPDLRRTDINPIDHFLAYGAKEGTSPNPLIDSQWLADTETTKAHGGHGALWNYLIHGRATDSDPHPLFDVSFYRQKAQLGSADDALMHYLRTGHAAGLSPCPLFDPEHYARQVPRLTESGVDPLVHYAHSPWSFLVDPHPLFDARFYARQIGSGASQRGGLRHYLTEGWRQGLSPHPLFAPEHYVAQHPELIELGIPPLVHYVEHGGQERTSPHPAFGGAAYLERYPDVAQREQNPLLHYVVQGKSEGRRVEPA